MIRADSLLEYARQQLKRMRSSLSAAVDPGEVEAVHRFRVASRRLKEPLELLAARVSPRKLKKARKDLKKMRQTFQHVRDMDVLLIHVGQAGTRDILDPSDLAYMEGQLTTIRSKALQKAAKSAEKNDHASRLKNISRLLDNVEKDIKDDFISHEPLSRLLQNRAHDLLGEDPSNEGSDLHDIRVRIKRLRYCAELSERLTANDCGDLIHAAKKMQDVLGDWNDYLVVVETISDLILNRDLLAQQTARAIRMQKYAVAWSESAEQQRLTALQRWPQLEQWIHSCVTGISGISGEAAAPTKTAPSAPIPPTDQG